MFLALEGGSEVVVTFHHLLRVLSREAGTAVPLGSEDTLSSPSLALLSGHLT